MSSNTLKSVSSTDKATLRELAKRVAEIAAAPEQTRKANLWKEHNDLKSGAPLILVFPEGSWREIMPDGALLCSDERCRGIELNLRRRIYYQENLRDDNVIDGEYRVPFRLEYTGWGLEPKRVHPDGAPLGADHFVPVLESRDDLEKLCIPSVKLDKEGTASDIEFHKELLGAHLNVVACGPGAGIAPLDHYSQLRGLEKLFVDLYEEPELVHETVGRLVDGAIAIRKSLEEQGVLTLNLGNHYAGSGGTCYTGELPSAGFDGKHVRNIDCWGFATAQIFSEVSPEMHEEFALRHERRFLELFGLNSYGCCEPLHRKLDLIEKNVPRLRRVSISPWADVRVSAEAIGRKYIFSWKPNPAILAGDKFNESQIMEDIRTTLKATKGCVVEMIMKDTHTVRNEPWRLSKWVDMARRVVTEFF
ncbi:MAG: hypothetical protein A2X49_02095 [Lentisphaerae bacterium GWF2_52_8]|nr:MAG: hypothetical protein A2X49_02095 [Lentisphaerae bacterium GWF2_52_8]